jgi:benzoate transport
LTTTDPREIIDQSKMTTAQFAVVGITVLLNAMDGFDVASIAFASPGIAREWGIARAQLGFVLSMELIGMGVGSFLIGGLADKIGRRPTLMACLWVMATGMFAASTASNPVILSVWRVFTGIGIGGMLAATNAVVGEFANKRHRAACIALMVIGYPLGAGFGGLYASSIIEPYGWRSVFYLGTTATVLLLPAVYFLVPESVHWLTRKQPADALAKVNASLRKLGQPTVAALPTIQEEDRKKSLSDIFSPALMRTTLMVTATFFFNSISFYFLAKWGPQIVSSMGFPDSAAGRVLAMANVGGALGGIVFGFLTARFGLKPATLAVLIANSLAISIFGRTSPDLNMITMLAMAVNFCGNAAISGMFSTMAFAFPTHVRATGTGFAIGVGRAGSALAPILAGFLLQGGLSLPTICMIMGSGSLLSACVLVFLKINATEPATHAGH